MKKAEELEKIFFFDVVGYIFVHWETLESDTPQEPFDISWDEKTGGSRAMQDKVFHHGNG